MAQSASSTRVFPDASGADVTANYADCTKARELLGWEAVYDIADMCRDSWHWQSSNPNGYEG